MLVKGSITNNMTHGKSNVSCTNRWRDTRLRSMTDSLTGTCPVITISPIWTCFPSSFLVSAIWKHSELNDCDIGRTISPKRHGPVSKRTEPRCFLATSFDRSRDRPLQDQPKFPNMSCEPFVCTSFTLNESNFVTGFDGVMRA